MTKTLARLGRLSVLMVMSEPIAFAIIYSNCRYPTIRFDLKAGVQLKNVL